MYKDLAPHDIQPIWFSRSQNYEEDTQWNDILRAKGIIPQKEKEVTEDDIVNLVEQTVKEKQGKGKKSLFQPCPCRVVSAL